MVVIADTSPLNYLILIEADSVLPQLYGFVLIPNAVIGELRHPDAPRRVLEWIAQPPKWLQIEDATAIADPALEELGAGEREAIILAQRQGEDVLLLMDEIRGRAEAARRKLVSTGTLGAGCGGRGGVARLTVCRRAAS